jgi:hypothetical protein
LDDDSLVIAYLIPPGVVKICGAASALFGPAMKGTAAAVADAMALVRKARRLGASAVKAEVMSNAQVANASFRITQTFMLQSFVLNARYS